MTPVNASGALIKTAEHLLPLLVDNDENYVNFTHSKGKIRQGYNIYPQRGLPPEWRHADMAAALARAKQAFLDAHPGFADAPSSAFVQMTDDPSAAAASTASAWRGGRDQLWFDFMRLPPTDIGGLWTVYSATSLITPILAQMHISLFTS